jgi:hypothetical protein
MKPASRMERLRERTAPMRERGQASLRDFEWTWTKAVLVALFLWFLALLFLGFVPSWWLYFADQKLGWRQCPCPSTFKFWLFKLRDAVAAGLFSVPFGAFIVIPFILQKQRRRLRSESESRPTGGYR